MVARFKEVAVSAIQTLKVWVLDVASGQAKVVGNDPGWCQTARSIRFGVLIQSGWLTPAACDPCITRSLLATSKPARLSKLPMDSRTLFRRPGMQVESISGFSRRRISACGSQWLDMTSYDHDENFGLYVAVLKKPKPVPYCRRVMKTKAWASATPNPSPDSGRGIASEPEASASPSSNDNSQGELAQTPRRPRKPVTVAIDFEGLQQRIVSVTGVPERQYSDLRAGADGTVFSWRRVRHAVRRALPAREEMSCGAIA